MTTVNNSLVHVRHMFHPVGQGLFCSGQLQLLEPASESCSWVYDCGANPTDKESLQREVSRFRSALGERRTIDLLILSHFDRDHIAGLRELLPGLTVNWVVLPYLDPADGVLLAVEQDAANDSDFVRHVYDPVALLTEFAGEGSIRNVAFVGAGDDEGGDGPVQVDGPPEPPQNQERDGVTGQNDRERRLKLVWEDPMFEDVTPPDSIFDPKAPQIFRLTREPRLRCGTYWEFLFLNRPAGRVYLPALRREVNEVLDEVRDGRTSLPLAVDRIRVLYRRSEYFGSDSRRQNDVSLLVYAGPIPLQGFNHWIERSVCRLMPADPQIEPCDWRTLDSLPWDVEPTALMYTGDVTMNAALRTRAQHKWGNVRWARIKTLQVPHHGAESGWKETEISEWAHRHSVFSYGTTNSDRHPRPKVIRALAKHGPVLVNEFQGFEWSCLQGWGLFKRALKKCLEDN